jgi:hypothetical protein
VKRTITTVVVVVLAVIAVTLIVIGACLDHVVKKAVEVYGPQETQTSVDVDTVHLSLLTGSASVKGLAVGNPSGYQTSQSIAVGTIAVGVDPTTVFAKKVVIRSIRVESPEITFEGGLAGNNLSQILDNVNSAGKSNGPLSTNAAAQPASTKKFEVDDLEITGGKIQVVLTGSGQSQQQVISLPDIHLIDLGKGADGITAADLTSRVLDAISTATIETVARSAANLDKNAASLKALGGDAKKQAGATLNNLLKSQSQH